LVAGENAKIKGLHTNTHAHAHARSHTTATAHSALTKLDIDKLPVSKLLDVSLVPSASDDSAPHAFTCPCRHTRHARGRPTRQSARCDCTWWSLPLSMAIKCFAIPYLCHCSHGRGQQCARKTVPNLFHAKNWIR